MKSDMNRVQSDPFHSKSGSNKIRSDERIYQGYCYVGSGPVKSDYYSDYDLAHQSVNETNLLASTRLICSSSTCSICFNETKFLNHKETHLREEIIEEKDDEEASWITSSQVWITSFQ
ncbi:hypothetical protein LWI29_012937 [Acer saccharum]|uniref:Uncharacterized protein n=1 Tax=Acer saccharum TaxID=4024 RepID=A0AA39VFZ1_ACESA|nr:hypothetical protein LWI29_012937 [Acer saccharum]